MTILLLGATGFLGTRLANELRSRGRSFIPVSLSLGTDLRDPAQFRKVFEQNSGIDQILHAATFIGGIKFGLDHPADIYRNNSLMSVNLYDLAREFKVRRIINPISNCSYPRDVFPEFKEELWWNGALDDSVAVYGLVRKASQLQSVAYRRQYGVQTINLIVPNMYGPNDHFDEVRSHALGALVMKIVKAKQNGAPEVIVWGTGRPVREWLYVDDCVAAMLNALDIPEQEAPINIGVGSGVSIAYLAYLIKKEVGYEGEIAFDTSKPDGAPYKVMNIDQCRRIFDWHPIELPEGIARTVQWYKSRSSDGQGGATVSAHSQSHTGLGR